MLLEPQTSTMCQRSHNNNKKQKTPLSSSDHEHGFEISSRGVYEGCCKKAHLSHTFDLPMGPGTMQVKELVLSHYSPCFLLLQPTFTSSSSTLGLLPTLYSHLWTSQQRPGKGPMTNHMAEKTGSGSTRKQWAFFLVATQAPMGSFPPHPTPKD